MLYPYPTVYFPGFQSMIFHFSLGKCHAGELHCRFPDTNASVVSSIMARPFLHVLTIYSSHKLHVCYIHPPSKKNNVSKLYHRYNRWICCVFENALSKNVVVLQFAGVQTPPWAQAEGGTESCLKLGTSNFHALSLVLCSTICLFWWCYQFWDTFILRGIPCRMSSAGWICSFWDDSNSLLCGFKLSLPSSSRIDNFMGRNVFDELCVETSSQWIVSIYCDSINIFRFFLVTPVISNSSILFWGGDHPCHQCFVYFWSGIQRHLSGS